MGLNVFASEGIWGRGSKNWTQLYLCNLT